MGHSVLFGKHKFSLESLPQTLKFYGHYPLESEFFNPEKSVGFFLPQ